MVAGAPLHLFGCCVESSLDVVIGAEVQVLSITAHGNQHVIAITIAAAP